MSNSPDCIPRTVASAQVRRQIPVYLRTATEQARLPWFSGSAVIPEPKKLEQWNDARMPRALPRQIDSTIKLPVVIRMSPMAHFTTGFLALGILVMTPFISMWGAILLIIPLLGSAAIVRLRTEADRDTVTSRTLFGSRTVAWDQIEGLRFTKSSWARACLKKGPELPLPAVTFATLPLLTAASAGRVPNPYQR